MTEIKYEKMPSSDEIIKVLGVYFRGIFFSPVIIQSEIEQEIDSGKLFDKALWAPFFNDDGSFNMRKMAGNALFKWFFPLEARRCKDDEFWKLREQRTHENKKKNIIGGIIRVFIDDIDDNFITRINEQVPNQNIKRNDDFNIPYDFFGNLQDNKIFVTFEIDVDEKGKNKYSLNWDFFRMNPSINYDNRESIYRTFVHYAERLYTAFFLGLTMPEEEKTPSYAKMLLNNYFNGNIASGRENNGNYELMKLGIAYCYKEIINDYKIEHPDIKYPSGELFPIINEMLEAPHAYRIKNKKGGEDDNENDANFENEDTPEILPNYESKTIDELKYMVFGELGRKKGKPLKPLTKYDCSKIKLIANKINDYISDKDKKELEQKLRDSLKDTAIYLYDLLRLIPDVKSSYLNDIRDIYHKIELDKADEEVRESIIKKTKKDVREEKRKETEEKEANEDKEFSTAVDGVEPDEDDDSESNDDDYDNETKEYIRSVILKALDEVFNKDEHKSFTAFIKTMSLNEISDLLEPYSSYSSSNSNTDSPIFKHYCNELGLTFKYMEDRRARHTQFAKKIREIFYIIIERVKNEKTQERTKKISPEGM